ncbi:Yip1 family protein [Candidatus Contubernalis alkaliaceticus]|uniref:Yip1 family protein n=1 Tax=Candidatus Contubernalis alkaliaceticus TaxID=338645 RepID=UPI001F4C3829|nr:Yip1 family protein [Candidatus Contubernalis alkalaceticus]UNC93149.1 YIP1 family protein [Candidatus Contubernalis alkalaceticus]
MKEEIITEEKIEHQGLGSSLKNILFKPSAAFKGANFKGIIIFTIIMMLVGGLLAGWTGVSFITQNPEVPLDEVREMEGMTEESLADVEELMTSETMSMVISISIAVGSVLGIYVGWLIKGGILTLAFNLMGGEAKYSKTLGVLGLAWIPFFLREIVRSAWYISTGEMAATASLLHNHADIFVLWNVLLLIFAFSAVCGLSKKKTAAAVLGYQALNIVLNLGLSSFNNMFTGGIM